MIALNNRYLIKTADGYKDFDGIKESHQDGLIITTNKTTIRCTYNHKILVGKSSSGKIFRKAKNLKVNDKIKGQKIISIKTDDDIKKYYDPINVQDTNSYLSDEITHHNCLYLDEVAWVKNSAWVDFEDAVFPSQGALAWKKTILTSTMKGLNHWYNIVKKAKKGLEYTFHEAKWTDVPRYDRDGNLLTPEEFQDSVINKYGVLYFNQNYLNEAVGSSHTMLSSDTLKKLKSEEPEEIRDNKLNVYLYPEKGHKYIMSVDAAKDGADGFSVQVVDITDFHFKQAASANLDIDYLLMPEFLFEWCEYYNMPYLIIENNEGAGQSIADQMKNDYEYENLHYDVKTDSNSANNVKSRKTYPGFRTTKRSRKQILQTMKLFFENHKLTIYDSKTISQLFTFILIKNKYQADDGTHDDLVMSLAMIFVPFISSKNFEDMKALIKNMYDYDNDLDEEEKVNMVDMMVVGNFDDGTDIMDEYQEPSETWNGFIVEDGGFI